MCVCGDRPQKDSNPRPRASPTEPQSQHSPSFLSAVVGTKHVFETPFSISEDTRIVVSKVLKNCGIASTKELWYRQY
jgi:hypothetical protein